MAALVVLASTIGACAKANTVTFSGLELNPATVTVAPGTTVTWVNNEQTASTVTSVGIATDTTLFVKPGPNQFNSGPLNPGQSFSHQFTTAGTYKYYDGIQGYITGTVIVK